MGSALDFTDFRRSHISLDAEGTIESGVWLIDHMCGHLGLDDLGSVDVLDYGCGVKFTQAILENDLPLQRYVGVDTYEDMIVSLQAQVHDDRFEHHFLNCHNTLYNPTGVPLSEATTLPVGDATFDVICLFSVFTHLVPADYHLLLKVLRRHVKPTGRCFYTLFLNETSEGGYGYTDAMKRAMLANPDLLGGELEYEVPDFIDANPEFPLRNALYSRAHALELIEGTGWIVESISPPDRFLQHHIVLAPDAAN